jgi:hypothetical protein
MSLMTRQKIGAVIGAFLLFGGLVAGVSMGAFAQDDRQNGDDNSGVEVPPPSGNADDPYDCGDFENRAQVEAVFNASNDVSGLDGDDDRIACESIEASEPTNETTEDTPTNETSTEDTPTDTPTEETPTEEQPPANDTEEMKDDEMQDTPKDDEATETPVDDEAPDEPQDDAEDEQHDDEMTDEKDDTVDEQKGDTTEETADEKADEEPPC